MISSKKLKQMARKWMKAAVAGRKRISFGMAISVESPDVSTAPPAEKGHFAMYTSDMKRFTIPLTWLSSRVFGELLKMAEDEYGLPSDGPIRVPFDAIFMENVVSLLKQRRSKNVEEALLSSINRRRCLAAAYSRAAAESSCQLLICSN